MRIPYRQDLTHMWVIMDETYAMMRIQTARVHAMNTAYRRKSRGWK